MLNIRINDDYSIKSDTHNYKIVEKVVVEKDGKKTVRETVLGFYTSLNGLYNGLIDRLPRKSDAKNFKELRDFILVLKDDINKSLELLRKKAKKGDIK